MEASAPASLSLRSIPTSWERIHPPSPPAQEASTRGRPPPPCSILSLPGAPRPCSSRSPRPPRRRLLLLILFPGVPPRRRQQQAQQGRGMQEEGGSVRRTGVDGGVQRCTHCSSEKTPQWRTGPLGPKTLCNACGVRYKSGRLVPEYRPAASPTFVLTQHSNSHRKVMELRRQKDQVLLRQHPAAATAPSAAAMSPSPRPDLLYRDYEVC